ncbi:MAG: hypothetical protein MUE40_07315 [Anaerolineae bacterium]|nr:hypothetical protein [Anaerolineae bacterium]
MSYPGTPPTHRKQNGSGCWLIGLITVVTVLLLVLVGLFLPPFDLYNRLFGISYVRLQTAGDTAASEDGALRIVAAADYPDDRFGVAASLVVPATFASAAAPDWLPVARSALPAQLALQSPVYVVQTSGTAPGPVLFSLALPVNGISPDILDVYGWYGDSSGGQWRFLPSQVKAGRVEATTAAVPQALALFQATPLPPLVIVAYDVNQVLTTAAGNVATIVTPAGLQPTLTGAINGSLAPGFVTNSVYMVLPVIRDFADPRALDTVTVEALISNSALRRAHVEALTAFAAGGGFDGVFIDYRGISADQRENFSAFIRELGASLRRFNLLLGVVVPAAQNVSGLWETGGYDWREIGAAAHYVQINLDLNPRGFTPGPTQPVEALLRYARGEISRYKIVVGLSARSVREIGGEFTAIGYDEALAGLGNVQVAADRLSETGSIEPGTTLRAVLDGMPASAGVETAINAPYVDYLNAANSPAARVWLTTGDALRFRMDSILPFALGGVAFGDLLAPDLAENILPTIGDFMTGLPAALAPVELVLRWRIEGSAGLIGEVTTGIREPLVVTLAAPDGNYAINVAVEGSGQDIESPRTGVQVAQFRPTPTPTPLPTATPTPVPTATFTPAPIVATPIPAGGGGGGGGAASAPAAPGGGNFAAVRPGSGSIAMGTFEYGGHVISADSPRTIQAMQRAGMTWMKIQKRFYPGSTADVPAGAIAAARANGFKILIGTVGSPADLQAGGDNYIQDYARWLGNIAAAGPDAIEVWNEPNLDREWPFGQISGAAYVNMLRAGYTAIKAANPGVMVISAAPAPTGAEAAYPGAVMNDDRFLREMIAAGGANYMDCQGVHYNEGIVPPNQTANDPRGDSYYTRFLPTMMNVYHNITGKPLCFTELGYVTSEGYPPLPDYFSWAQNVTVAQQAAWLAQAAAILSQSGYTRMMIVWNVDFTLYAGDPQGGYAILRPDGSCPACEALAAAR